MDRISLLTQDLHNKLTGSGASVKIDEHDLLPRSQQKGAGREWNGDGRPLELPSKVAVPVVFPRVDHVVLPARIGRNEAIPKHFRVGPNPRFILNNHDGGSGVFDKDRHDPGPESRSGHGIGDEFRNILELRATLHANRQRHRLDSHQIFPLIRLRR